MLGMVRREHRRGQLWSSRDQLVACNNFLPHPFLLKLFAVPLEPKGSLHNSTATFSQWRPDMIELSPV